MKNAVIQVKYAVVLSICALLPACQQTYDASNDTPLASAPNQAIECMQDCEPSTDSSQDTGVIEVIHPLENEVIPQLFADSTHPVIDSAPVETNLWQYIANNTEFESPANNQRVLAQKNWYLKHPTYMRRVSQRASPFLYYIVGELQKNDIPVDIALLPIVESAFDPFAFSHGRAAGMWQFIPGTGKRFGMPQNWWYDGRRDVVRSTQGAIKYLQYLHDFFDGNWLHALAAYNSGEGRVKKAIRRNKAKNKPTDFWSLDLPKETRAYVPKLLALVDILKNAEQYKYNWPEIKNQPVIDIVKVNRQIELNRAAEFTGLSVSEFRALNPGFNRWATPPDQIVELVIPIKTVPEFLSSVENASEDALITWKRHKIRSGENLGSIAQKYSTTVDVIRTLNDLNGSTIIAGRHLLIPAGVDKDDRISKTIAKKLSYMESGKRTLAGKHVVQSGDTLWDIAREYRVSVRDLSSWNKISSSKRLKIGTELNVYQPNTVDKMTYKRINYKVRQGDSLSRIADKFNIRVNQIISWNDLQGEKYLQPGQRLKLNVNVTAM